MVCRTPAMVDISGGRALCAALVGRSSVPLAACPAAILGRIEHSGWR